MRIKPLARCLLLSVAAVAAYSALVMLLPLRLESPVEIRVSKGMTFSETLRSLQEKGLVRDGTLIRLVGKVTGIDRRIKTGIYEFSGTPSPFDVIRDLTAGRVAVLDVTIPEGYNMWQIARTLDAAGLVPEGEFFMLAYDRAFLDGLGIDAPSIEGYIFPDTYTFPRGMAPRDVLMSMVAETRRRFSRRMRLRAEELGLSEREVLTLASIIEKEAKFDDERPLISAVFHNRLKRGIPLQADPTCVYGFKAPSEGITAEDLRRDSPYNTYVVRGLPPGPIASPGIESIRAALYPADVPYLFFVSRNDGRHRFSVTEAEHRRAVESYRSARREGKF